MKLKIAEFLFYLCIFVFPISLVAQTQSSRAGDEAALEALYSAAGGSGWTNRTGWSASGMSLSDTIYGVSTASIDGELRVTRIDLRYNNLSGNIEVPEIGNLTEMTLFAVYGNSLHSQIPQELMDLTRLEYLYLCVADPSGELDTVYPHEQAQTGSGDIHPSKRKTGENNVFTGNVPAPSTPSAMSLKWFILNWTDSAVDATDGISSISPGLFEVATFEGLQIYNNNGITNAGNSFAFPTGILNMTNLDQLAIGTEKAGRDTGPIRGTIPASFLEDLPNLRHVRFNENNDLRLDLDHLNAPAAGHAMQTFSMTIIEVVGSLPSFFFDGSLPDLNAFIISWPRHNTGATGSPPEVNGSVGIKIYQYYDNELTALPASLWTGYGGIIQAEFRENNLTTIGTADLTQQYQLRYLRLAGNELHENWPYLSWDYTLTGGINMEDNRYVFKHMLYVPPNAPNGETVFELYKSVTQAGEFSYAPQKPFGQSRTIGYTAGSDVTIDDFDGVVTHPDNAYQWQKDGSDISGATSRSLTIADAQPADAGTYRLVVTNPNVSDLTLRSQPIELTAQ